MGTLKTFVEIPITVFYEAYKEDGDGWNLPKIPAHVDVEYVEIQKDIEAYILKKFSDELRQECEDDAAPDDPEPDYDRHRDELHPGFGCILRVHLGETGGKA